MQQGSGVFTTSYLPSRAMVFEMIHHSNIVIENHEPYRKQTFRNRCMILSANGPLRLTIPVKHISGKTQAVKEILISYDEPWQRKHYQALKSAYGRSPFFEFYDEPLQKILFAKHKRLIELNNDLLAFVFQIFKPGISISATEAFRDSYPANDFRYQPGTSEDYVFREPEIDYPQVFSSKFGFTCDLSILDFIFNSGPFTGIF